MYASMLYFKEIIREITRRMMSTALIHNNVLKWARERSHIDIAMLAHKLPVKSEKIVEWEEGVSRPTFKQAQKLAKVLHVPFGYLFLPEPPDEKLPVPDLRTVGDRKARQFSVDLRDVIADVLRKQDWYRDYRIEERYERIPFIGKFSLSSSVFEISKDITTLLRLSIAERTEAANWEQFLRLLIDRSEELGLWIMRSGKVGNNTRRILEVDEFRGFALCDEYAPVVFLNGTDAKAAQIFSLVHELTHLWLGESGISDLELSNEDSARLNEIERKCNEVAAEVLVPKAILQDRWNRESSLSTNAEKLSRFFKVSGVVIARRALDIGLVQRFEFFAFYQQQSDSWRREKERHHGGGDFYRNLPIANGRHFTEAVIQSVFMQNTLMRDGARLLGTNTVNLEKMAERIGFL